MTIRRPNLPLQAGQYFRNTDSQGCVARIKAATASDIDELKAARYREAISPRSRKRLLRALTAKLREFGPQHDL